MDEFERTYLIKKLPEDLKEYSYKEMLDIYLPKESQHPKLRIRKNGDKYEMTKKEPAIEGDASHLIEQTIILTKPEFESLSKLEGLRVCKNRYNYIFEGHKAEIDVFLEDLTGLVLVDFEFESKEAKDSFKMPDFCLVEVTQEEFIAGGKLCGKKYADIEPGLAKFEYKAVFC